MYYIQLQSYTIYICNNVKYDNRMKALVIINIISCFSVLSKYQFCGFVDFWDLCSGGKLFYVGLCRSYTKIASRGDSCTLKTLIYDLYVCVTNERR
jgi:hypothetical protein